MIGDPYGDTLPPKKEPRCWKCNKLLAEWVSSPWRIRCQRCKSVNQHGDPPSRDS